jgi:SAM-dependent methyltransferase
VKLPQLYKKIKRKLGLRERYSSETSKVRPLLISYCKGKGCDIGFGGDKIKKQDCVGIDYQKPYAYTGNDKVDIACDVMNEKIPVDDNTFDYVYTSHLIEDFIDTKYALEEFIRILKSGGHLILVFPDQKVYEEYCLRTGQSLNVHHVHREMGMEYMLAKLNSVAGIKSELIFSSNCEIDYNVLLVLKIHKS